jgi:hypothetical protein
MVFTKIEKMGKGSCGLPETVRVEGVRSEKSREERSNTPFHQIVLAVRLKKI